MELRHWWEHGHEKNKNKLAGWKAFIDKLFAKVLWLSELPRCKEMRILLDQNISKVEQIVNSEVVTEEGKCQKNMGGGGGQGFIEVSPIHSGHISGQNLVWAIIGLTEQLNQH